MVLGRKTNFFLGKTKKNQKKHLLGNYAAKLQKDCFLVFPRKKLVFLPKTIFFLGKVSFSAQNHLFPRKNWFFCPKPTFS